MEVVASLAASLHSLRGAYDDPSKLGNEGENLGGRTLRRDYVIRCSCCAQRGDCAGVLELKFRGERREAGAELLRTLCNNRPALCLIDSASFYERLPGCRGRAYSHKNPFIRLRCLRRATSNDE
jgi:hypothetical protein